MNNLLFRPKNLIRKRIQETLTEACEIPLILIVAPMGYGKTTVVKDFLKDKNGMKVWLSFGENEADETWIWTRLYESVLEVGFSIGEEMKEMGFPKSKYQINRFLHLIKDYFIEPFYIVFDDCHECQCNTMAVLVEAIAYENIPNLHIILISRTYPNIQYEEMWMKGVCVLMEQSFLALSQEEIVEFFQINGEQLSIEEQNQIYEYTEGWVSATYLVLMDYKKNGVFCNRGGITSIVKKFIFDKLSQQEKLVLMQMSLFDDFSIEQANYITKMECCTYLLPKFAEKIGFIKYNIESNIYSFHAVLRAVVSAEREKAGINKEQLFEYCGQWYEREEKKIYAIKYYDKAENPEKVLKLIEKWNCSSLYEQAPGIIHQFFDKLEMKKRLKYPIAYLPYIYELIIHGDFTDARQLYEKAKEFYLSEEFDPPEKNKILGELMIVEWNLHFNDLKKMCQCAKCASELLNNGRSSIFGSDIILTFGTPELLFLYHNSVGKLKETLVLEKQFATYYMRLINGYEGGWDALFEAEYHFTRGEMEEAEKNAILVCEKAELREQICVLISGYMVLIRCDIHKGRREAFHHHLSKLGQKIEMEKRLTLKMEYDLAYGFLNGLIGNVDTIPLWLKDFDLEECNHIIWSVRSGCVTYGILLIERQQWIQLESLAEKMSVPYSISRHIMVFIYAKIYYAIAEYHLERIEKAMDVLKEGIDMAAPDGIKMPFVENIMALEPVLKELGKTEPYAKDLLLMGMEQKRGINVVTEEKNRKILTEREYELLELVGKGYKNSEISNALNVALVTVEKTLTNIYRKLEVSNRTAAILRLRELEKSNGWSNI